MEYIDGKNIGEFISDYNHPFLPESSVSLDNLFVQLIEGFVYIESQGIIHRDIRENNILIDKSGIVKIIDFGIGKVVEKGDPLNDSLVSKINREGSDTLPQEYFEGVYTSKTDMFYLGELLHRLLNNKDNEFFLDETNFSYFNLLDKMMKKNPDDRYSNFSEIREAIDKYDFLSMDITTEDKRIYQAFTDALYGSISSFIDEIKFNYNIDQFISQLEKTIQDNSFEDRIQDNRGVIRSIVKSSCNYDPSYYISCNVVETFYRWFKKSTLQSQQLILNNAISKLSTIETVLSADDIPF
jgi:serine/threonine-protein kinase